MIHNASSVTDFRISLRPPRGWQHVDLNPARHNDHVDRAVAGFGSQLCIDEESKSQWKDYLQQTLLNAWTSGMRVMLTSAPIPDDLVPLLATYTVNFLRPTSAVTDPEHQLELVTENLLQDQEQDHPDAVFDISRVALPHMGDAIQVAQVGPLENRSQTPGTDLKVASLRTFIPAGPFTIHTRAFTPQIYLSDVAFELFSEVNATIRSA